MYFYPVIQGISNFFTKRWWRHHAFSNDICLSFNIIFNPLFAKKY